MSTISNLRPGVNHPPTTNRGVENPFSPEIVFSLDWLTFTIWLDFREVCILLESLGLYEGLEFTGHGAKGFQYLYLGLDGLQVKVNINGYCSVVMPGAVCQKLSPEQFQSIYEYALAHHTRFHATRCDPALDTQIFTAGDVWSAVKSDDLSTYVKRENITHYETADGLGETVYLGSRKSLQMLRVYQKQMPGHVVFGDSYFARAELELHDDRATDMFIRLCTSPLDAWKDIAMGALRGFVEFKTAWWEKFTSGVSAWWLRLTHKRPTIQSKLDWINRQVLPNLALVAFAMKGQTVNQDGEIIPGSIMKHLRSMVYDGRSRWTKKHLALLALYDPDEKLDFAIFSA